ncbi:MAG: hypothetical protein V4582_06500 [Pseudomonadota bacterium]
MRGPATLRLDGAGAAAARQLMLGLALCLAARCAGAQDSVQVTFSGFGTAALTMSDTDQAEFGWPTQAAGVKKAPRSGVDSNLGVQVTAASGNWSLTAQGLTRKFVLDRYGEELSWAYAKLKLGDDVSVRVGRLGMPVYMVSDARNIGYAFTMLRTPIEMYRQVQIDHVDGADLLYQRRAGATTFKLQVLAGASAVHNVDGSTGHFQRLREFKLVAERGPVTFSLARLDTVFSVPDNVLLNSVVDGLIAAGYPRQAELVRVRDTHGAFTSAGFELDWHGWLVQSELGRRQTDARSVMDTTAYYLMLGYQLGPFTPYYTYSTVAQNSPRGFAELPTSGAQAGLVALANAVTKTGQQSTNTIGLRWDFNKSAALKLQLDRIMPRDGAGSFIKAAPGFKGPVTVYAAGIDFLF